MTVLIPFVVSKLFARRSKGGIQKQRRFRRKSAIFRICISLIIKYSVSCFLRACRTMNGALFDTIICPVYHERFTQW